MWVDTSNAQGQRCDRTTPRMLKQALDALS